MFFGGLKLPSQNVLYEPCIHNQRIKNKLSNYQWYLKLFMLYMTQAGNCAVFG